MTGNPFRILLTGGSGRLGKELQKYLRCDHPSHQEMDVTDLESIVKWQTNHKEYDIVIHCAGYTNVAKAEKEPDECYRVNFWGTYNMANAFSGTPFVYISTEYVYNPVNVYSWSKKAGEGVLRSPYMIIRTLFKPRPYPYKRAWNDQWTRGDYVDVIAPMIMTKIWEWNKTNNWTVNIGTGRKTIYDLARMSNPDVDDEPLYMAKLEVELPKDYLCEK